MNRKQRDDFERRQRLREQFSTVYDDISRILFAHDPIGINFGDNADEYEPEVGTILPRLSSCQSEGDLRVVIHQEFTRWFGAETAGDESRYKVIATEIWTLHRAWKTEGEVGQISAR